MRLRRTLSYLPEAIAGVCLVYVFLFNLQGVWRRDLVPGSVARIGHGLGIEQRWDMFAPSVSTWDGWFTIAGLRADGRVVDLLYGGEIRGDRSDPRPRRVHPYRMAEYLRYLIERPPDRQVYAAWLCRSGNETARPSRKLVQVEMHFVLEETPPPGTPPVTETHRLFSARCSGADAEQQSP